ncbi:DUF1929-domain-containing protein [Punctularia strigosozonata HHB-11173 SS5]|uniref:DUF1929-domain-containing protein n=1 Tax=Punctularia strigosozonata (strain HHB-11173) TaxID=741275 RepID=R7S5J5_PUNST|nr:DUF1929-domain-containing protein [Punctularia strigosozonata HHB-11173 SS5]EIN04691.1 DUF1929-domain-containing protein [Punctularia strigosozonata HHB-11173 SS5]
MLPTLSLLAAWLASSTTPASAASSLAGTFADGGNTLVSAMMMFLGNDEKVYILDKVEGNAAQINGHPAWASIYDIASRKATAMDVTTNAFCSSGMHLPNGSFVTFGGNGAIGPGGNIGSLRNNAGSGAWDDTYMDVDGTKSIRILNPCSSATINADQTVLNGNASCGWYDDPNVLSMQSQRWYSTAEALADGSIVIIGGFVNGGYINRNYPNTDPAFEGGAANPTYEFFPSRGQEQQMNFMVATSGLNAYPHSFLMPSGKMLVQANFSTVLWDYDQNQETPLPDMPGKVIRVYPASGATAMLPLTPANNYTPTVIFCGGSDMPDYAWGNYSWPFIDTWDYPASKDCQRITPEQADGTFNTDVAYEQDDDMIEGRTMGQFIILPTGKLMVFNGGVNGTAGYSTQTLVTTSYSEMPFGMSLASGPVGTPALYDPDAPKGSRWTNEGFDTSNIPRLYHSSALLLPDASVLIAGSNPNVDVNTSTVFPTTYQAEIFYPPYFAASTRPSPSGMPTTLSYGGAAFDITVPASSYSGAANDAADNTTVALVRPGWTTHGMNMGQRYLQLNNTYTVNSDGSITLHVAQVPPNPNLFTPGPALLFVTVNGIPSNGTSVLVGSGSVGAQPTAAQAVLPASVRLDSASGTASGSSTSSGSGSGSGTTEGGSHTGAIIGGIVAGVAAVGVLGAIIGICVARRRRAARAATSAPAYAMSSAAAPTSVPMGPGMSGKYGGLRTSDSSAFVPLQGNVSTASLGGPYRDEDPYATPRPSSVGSGAPLYQQQHQQHQGQGYDSYYESRR